ncbi:uncharacterized protein HMPREF1541_02430 [Cyphellophora europaea CBS 101466]|uniref:Uncharacterized protein n=1 Tax=Cyphellophora europaea (strain CBS 101466) TaxID=1220924 RepID=W2S3I6_CYPE1|nr:uncharacterized protein HMPREF1541_02430 [Cyphellophora europaea CBS 101466]ETN43271.1 hypothetical protein HMPREF1541_02430 [Cyphellophora europaea CBS 101466]
MEPEGYDSDVSATASDRYRAASPPAIPAKFPVAMGRLESSEAVDARLRDLNHVENQNNAKLERLRAKRKRMDERIAQKRDVQDRKIKAIMDARQRRDSAIAARRAREDAEFRRVMEQVDEEEDHLRRRLKALKRGFPDESPVPAGRSISTASTSPPGPTYSTIPPPAKRHQSNPPGQTQSPLLTQGGAPPSQPTAQAPSYSFYQGGTKPYSVPYHSSSAYSTVPPPPATHAIPPQVPSQPSNDRSPFGINGRPASPLSRPPLTTPVPPTSALSTAPPPRQTSSTYDTRPPPPTAASSGFATINAPPPSSGFATINARSAATPPSSNSPLARSELDHSKSALTPSAHPENATGAKSSSANSTPAATGKRTPSTTHPYQMSEAFANRHHHCERVDDLNRGIWTSHGPGGTQEHPTGPPVEMYLRCNHDNCRRIDWRTVHGLQCHIVKSHEQPKGTIGSLEKALDRYGVPVKEVEEYEKEHGEGMGGTMADPKNMKIKNKTREVGGGRKSTPGGSGVDPNVRPAGYKPSPTASPTAMHSVPRFSGPGHSPVSAYGAQTTPGDHGRPYAPTTGPAWNSVNSAYGPPRATPVVDTNKQLQGDAVMKEAPAAPPSKAPGSASGPQPATGQSRPEQKAYEFVPKPFEYPPRPHPPTQPAGDRMSQASSTPTPTSKWGSAGREVRPTPTPTPSQPLRWGAPRNGETQARPIGHTWEPRPLGPAEQKHESKKDAAAFGDDKKVPDADTVMGGMPSPRPDAVAPAKREDIAREEAPKEPEKAAETATPSAISSVPAPAPTAADDAMEIDGVEDKKEAPAESALVPSAATEPAPTSTLDKPEITEAKEATPAASGPASGTRSAQSPLISNKPLSAPTSAKRVSRRSSMARKLSGDSGDGQANAAAVQAEATTDGADGEVADEKKSLGEPVEKAEAGVEEDGDDESITVASKDRDRKDDKESLKEKEKMEPRTPPRRAASGRFTRKSNR